MSEITSPNNSTNKRQRRRIPQNIPRRRLSTIYQAAKEQDDINSPFVKGTLSEQTNLTFVPPVEEETIPFMQKKLTDNNMEVEEETMKCFSSKKGPLQVQFNLKKQVLEDENTQTTLSSKTSTQKPRLSLRQKMRHLLPTQLGLKIGQSHKNLIEKMCCLDRILKFAKDRDQTGKLLSQLFQMAKTCMKKQINEYDVKQLLFLNNKLYNMSWRQDKTGEHVIFVATKQINPKEETRKLQVRKEIVNYLMEQYKKFLIQKSISVSQSDEIQDWKHGFCPDSVNIPLGQFPLHPLQKKTGLQNMNQNQIQAIANPDLQSIIKNAIGQNKSSIKRQLSKEVLNKTKPENFKDKLYEIVRQKQLKLAEQRKAAAEAVPRQNNKTQLIHFCEHACQLFISRRVGSIFMVNFIEMMRKRLGSSFPIIEKLLEQVLSNQICFLTKLVQPTFTLIQFHREKYNQILKSYGAE